MGHIEVPAKAGDIYVAVLMDEEDVARLGKRRLSLGSHGYAQTFIDGKNTLVHRWILGLTKGDGLIGDHRNGNRLDNRRCNLRIVTASGSSQNVAGRAKSGYRGVYPQRNGRWYARVKFQGAVYELGTYDTPEEAAVVAAAKRAELMPFCEERFIRRPAAHPRRPPPGQQEGRPGGTRGT